MDEKKKKSKLPLIVALSVVLVLCSAFAGLCVTGVLPVLTEYGFVSLETALILKDAVKVSDEETLRELLLRDEELNIVLKEDLEISDTFVVVGNKGLYGNAVIKADIAGLFEQRSILSVQKDAHLTMNGLTLDGGGMADGIEVKQNGELTYKAGRVQYVRYGITAHGTVNVEDIDVEHISTAGIYASFKSKVYVKGGTIRDSYTNLLSVETGGYMEVYEGLLATDSIGVGVVNAGTLYLYGGEISHTGGHGIENKGLLETEYKGSQKDGYIYIHDTKRRAINVNTDEDTVIKDLYAKEIGSNAIYVTDKVTQGNVTIEHCKFDHAGITDGNTFSFSSNVTIKDAIVLNAGKGGLYARSGSKVVAEDIIFENCNGIALEVIGTLTAKNITIDGAAKHGLAVGYQDDIPGSAEITNITMTNVEQNNIVIRKGASATLIDSTLNKSKRTSIYVTENGSLVLDSVQVLGCKDDRLNAINMEPNTEVTLKGDGIVTGSTNRAIKVNENAVLNMEGGKICDVNADVSGPAVGLVGAGATFNMSGGSITNNTTSESSGAVYVESGATFNMSGGTISGNTAKKSGGAAQIRGFMNMTGGVIENNEAGTNGGGLNAGADKENGIFGNITITGGTIRNNTSYANGGGVSVSGGTSLTFTAGTIQSNTARGIGSGIYTNGKVTLGENIYIKDNEIELNEADVVVKILGNSLKYHSADNPLFIVPNYELAENGLVVECESASAAKTLAKVIYCGNEAYFFSASSNGLVSNVQKADMDMTEADKVYVSNYVELKEAVETANRKRYIVITADIAIEKVITVPQGATVCIKDDGKAHKLTRTEGLESNFFRTYYGTGLYITATAYGNLILDGTASDSEAHEPILRVRGTTEIRNVIFQNNYTAGDGAFIRHHFGQLSVYNSSFNNGKAASAAGAVKVVAGTAYFEGVSFNGNESAKSGGAIKVEDMANVTLELVSCHFNNNTAGSLGGAINAAGGTLKVTDTFFAGNKANGGKAGAVSATDCVAVFNGNGSFISNTSTEEAGALYVNRAKLTLSGYEFIENKADRGGAIYIGGSGEDDGNEITDCTFLGNYVTGVPEDKDDTSGKGGAVFISTKTTVFTNCTFGAEGQGNTANSNGGALYVASGATVELNGSNEKAVFAYNNTLTDGGAICVGSGTLNIKGYTFDHNSADNAGAIQFNNSQIAGNISGCTFNSNTATAAHGGAIKVNVTSDNGSRVVITESVFGGSGMGNTAKKNGGAIWLAEKATTDITDCAFVGNSVLANSGKDETNRGGAIFSDGAELTITNTKFDTNHSYHRGGAVYSGNNGILTFIGTNENAQFVNNISYKDGAAIGSGSGTVNITGYTFNQNSAKNNGGAIWVDANVTSKITNAVFTGNTTTSVESGDGDDNNRGGAIFNNGATITVTNTSFTDNKAVKNGGAIYIAKEGVVKFIGEGSDASNAFFKGSETNADGGAICIGSGTLNIKGYTFEGNIAGKNGGAVNIANGKGIKVEITDSYFNGNKANDGQGASVKNNSEDKTVEITIKNSVFENEYAKKSGGSIYNRAGVLTIISSSFKNNSGSVGGAINQAGGSLTATSCTFEGNQTRDKSEGGGAIIATGGSMVTLDGNGVFKGNVSANHGGAIYSKVATFNISNQTFEENKAATYGGACMFSGVTVTMKDSDFIGNTAEKNDGGACRFVDSSNVTIVGGTFKNNTAKANGGAIANGGSGSLTITGAVFSGNQAAKGNAGYVKVQVDWSSCTFEEGQNTVKA